MRGLRLGVLLVVMIAACNYMYDPISLLYVDSARAAKNLFYAFRGIEGAILFALVAALSNNRLIWAVCTWGFYEESQTTICSATNGFGNKWTYQPFEGLCGSGWYAIGIFIAFALACAIDNAAGRRRDQSKPEY